ncbi:Bacterial regulatory protein, MarR [mine drainage metagenome]|uniref:Bacterial regulatory protein, MarR n=1 Tax=mine drainage metagenome TaxID=410659 RepID=T1BQ11_9ZZZZ
MEPLWTPSSDPQDALWESLRQVMTEGVLLSRHYLAASGVTLGQYVVLQRVRADPSLRSSQLARELGVSRPTMSILLRLLERKSWITRTVAPTDRRGQVVRLTPLAERLLASVDRASLRTGRSIVRRSRLARDPKVIAALREIAEALRSERSEEPPRRTAAPRRDR